MKVIFKPFKRIICQTALVADFYKKLKVKGSILSVIFILFFMICYVKKLSSKKKIMYFKTPQNYQK